MYKLVKTVLHIGKSKNKKSYHNARAINGGGKGRAIKEKRTVSGRTPEPLSKKKEEWTK